MGFHEEMRGVPIVQLLVLSHVKSQLLGSLIEVNKNILGHMNAWLGLIHRNQIPSLSKNRIRGEASQAGEADLTP